MRNVILYSAITIDGYIAKRNGNLDWLYEFDKSNNEASEIFTEFYNKIDTTLIGNNTYRQICESGNIRPYKEKTNYVFSKEFHKNDENVTFVQGNIEQFILDQKKRPGQDIWLVGGGQLNNTFYEINQIDQIILDIIPVILGEGIPLLSRGNSHQFYKQEFIQSFPSGRVQIRYRKYTS